MVIRKFLPTDAAEVSAMIAETLRISNAPDYSCEYIENLIDELQPQDILERAAAMHFYVVCMDNQIVGSGAIAPYCGQEDESCLYSVFIAPTWQRRGIGRKIIQTLEQDEYGLRSRRIMVPASITGVPFYKRLGYVNTYDGNSPPDENGLVMLQKEK